MQSSRPSFLPDLAIICAMVLWASSFVALKIAFRVYDPMVVIFGRMLVASVCFLFIARRLPQTLEYRSGDYKPIIFMAFCEPCLYFLFEAKAVVYTTASQAGIITAMLPILVMIAAAYFLKETISLRSWFSAIAALLGVCWLTLESSPAENAPNPLLGNFYEFIAMVCATGYTITIKTLSRRYSPFFLTAMQAFIGTLFYLPLLFLPSTPLPTHFDPVSGMAIIYLGAAITLGAYGLYNYGLKYIDASKATLYVNLIPIFSVLMGYAILDEALTAQQMAAGCLIMGSVYLSQSEK